MLADGELARRCRSGDENAWVTLVDRYQRRIWYVAYQFTGRSDEAEELTQEIFLHLLHALDNFDSAGSLQAWIQRVARNYAIDHYRRRRRERSLVVDGDEFDNAVLFTQDRDESTDPHHFLEQRDLSKWLRSAIDKLPVELAQAVLLRDLQEMTYEEMADALNIPLGTVKSRINRGRVELAKRLKRQKRAARNQWDPPPPTTFGGGNS